MRKIKTTHIYTSVSHSISPSLFLLFSFSLSLAELWRAEIPHSCAPDNAVQKEPCCSEINEDEESQELRTSQ